MTVETNLNNPENNLFNLLPAGHKFDAGPLGRLADKLFIEPVTESQLTALAHETLSALVNSSSDGKNWTEPGKEALLEYYFGLNPKIDHSGEITGFAPTEKPQRAKSVRILAQETGCCPKTLRNLVLYGIARRIKEKLITNPLFPSSDERAIPPLCLNGGLLQITEDHQIKIFKSTP